MSRYIFVFPGSFLLLISLLSFVNIIYSYYFNLYLNVSSYLPTLISSLFLGLILVFYKSFNFKKITIYQKIFTVVLGYLILPVLISFPYYFSIYNITFIDSYFEAISGFTSTGFTIFENIKHIDSSLILWRSTSQWIGGLYFLFCIILLIDLFDNKLKNLFTNFITFNSSEFLKQSFKIVLIYVFLTFFIFLILKFINLRNFDALNFALTIISSGGFKPINEINYLLKNDFKIIMFSLTFLLSFFSLFLIYNLVFLKNKYLNFFTEDFYLLLYLLFIISIFFIFFSDKNFSLLLLSITSSVSNIGIFYYEDSNRLSFLYLILVIIGGSFFSTSSGLRFFKILTLIKFSLNELLSHSKPKQILINKVMFGNDKVDYDVINKYFLSILIFVISLTTITFLLSLSGIKFENSIKLGLLTIMNTVNSSLYALQDFNFSNLNISAKVSLICFMIIGRVEFITLIILIKKYLFKN